MAGVVAGARACVKNNIAASLRPALLPVSSVVNRPSHPLYTRVRALPRRRRRIDRIVGVCVCGVYAVLRFIALLIDG